MQIHGRLQIILYVTWRGKKALAEYAGNSIEETVIHAKHIVGM
jgi:hypothetical protein